MNHFHYILDGRNEAVEQIRIILNIFLNAGSIMVTAFDVFLSMLDFVLAT